MLSKIAALSALVAVAKAQQVCVSTPEVHPRLAWSRCAAGGTCSNVAGSVTIDANWRWLHRTTDTTNCYDGNEWNEAICTSGTTCASTCCVEGANYAQTYGATTSGTALDLKFVTTHSFGKNIGSRVYLMESDTKYQGFTLLNNEFTFDVDVSNLQCGLNGALYFISMDLDGGMAKFPGNKAGAKYGTGYCDSQCPRDVKFIGGVANVEGWNPSSNDANAGVGELGACCAEMDIWEANNIATAYTPHPCANNDYHSCKGDLCGGTYSADRYAGDCDPDGCDFNSWRQGNKTFYGPGAGFTVDTTKPVTVVTQFLTGSDGVLSDIKRFYVQNGRTIGNSESLIPGVPGNSITADFCVKQKAVFGDSGSFFAQGGLAKMSEALAKPMVLALSLWDDHYANMLWLDSIAFPADKDPSTPGVSRGSCAVTSGVPAEVEAQFPNASVKFSNIKFGPIGSTFNQGNVGVSSSVRTSTRTTTSSIRTSTSSIRTTSSSVRTSSTRTSTTIRTTSTTSSAPVVPSGAARWQQCGGINWNGPFTCQSPWTCQKLNDYFFQCL